MPKNHNTFHHYGDSDLPTAMTHPAYDKAPDDKLDLASLPVLGERRPSDPEVVAMVRAFNAAPGELPSTPMRTLLQNVPSTEGQMHLAGANTHDGEVSNGILYLKADKFVRAIGLDDFMNGRPDLKNGRPSRDEIRRYAAMSSRTMPPVTAVQAYYEVQSGNTYYSLVGDGAHRLAGSIQRGDEYIPSSEVSFIALEDDIITEQLATLEQEATRTASSTRRRFGQSVLRRLGVSRK
jgi:hypothetical protein